MIKVIKLVNKKNREKKKDNKAKPKKDKEILRWRAELSRCKIKIQLI